MATVTGRLFPSSSRLDVDKNFRTTKTVDRSNAYSRFSARSSSRVNDTTMDADLRPMSTGRRSCGRSVSSDPFDGTRRDVVCNMPSKGLRMTGMESAQQERGRRLEDNPRNHKRAASPSSPSVDHSDKVFTAKGDMVRGRRGPSEYPALQVDFRNHAGDDGGMVAAQCARARSSERFRNTPHANTNHILCPTPVPTDDLQRSTMRFSRRPTTPTLHGVLHPVVERQPPAYRVRAPFHTDE